MGVGGGGGAARIMTVAPPKAGSAARPAVFLDRDGVITRPLVRERRPYSARSQAELELLPGVPEALRALDDAGYCLVVVTNQPDVARGQVPRAAVEAMHEWLQATLPLAAVLMCAHDDEDHCLCRKPLPGLITQAAARLHIDCARSYMIGDRWKDVEAGRRAGCTTVFVDRGYDEQQPPSCDIRVSDLAEAARTILAMRRLRDGEPGADGLRREDRPS